MKLRAITLNNVRRFTSPVRIGEIGDGLNLLCEPNEHGKSTLFDAIQALFFTAHGSRAKEARALQPHAGGAPEVEVEIETAEGRFVVSKQWLSKPSARILQNGRLIAQADEAEAWIADRLGGGDGGPAGLIWVRQGATGLTDGSRGEQDAALEARRDLMSSVAGEVEAMTGGRRMDAALARCREELATYATSTGRPRTGGPWKAAEERVIALASRRDELEATTATLREALAERKRCRRALSEIEEPEAAAQRKERLETALAVYRAAERHAEALDVERRKVDAARLALKGAQDRLETFRLAEAERREARALKDDAERGAQVADVERASAAASLSEAVEALAIAEAVASAARDALHLARRRGAAIDGAQRRAELAERIAAAEAARAESETAGAAARVGPDAKTLRRLEELAAGVGTARALRDAAATQLVMRYLSGREGAASVNGVALPGDRPTPAPNGATITFEGVGELEVTPGAGAADDHSVEAAETKLREALEAAGAADLEAARASADARAAAERSQAEARARLQSLAPDGIEALRALLASIPAVEDVPDGPDAAEAETALSAAEAARTDALARREAAALRHADARSAEARAAEALKGARERLRRAEEALTRLGGVDVASLEADRSLTAAALEEAETTLRDHKTAAPDFAAAEAVLKRARAVEDEARREIERLRPELARLDERIARSSGEAVEERLAEAKQELAVAEADLARIAREVAVLQKLDAALEKARSDARDRYFAPVAAELRPLLQLLWPDASLSWGHQTLLPDALIRDGQEEPIEILSGGTQEQVAFLVRLAFARLMARAGRHAPVILDDALVYSDDDRIERMFDALHRQAGDLQIIVLSCRQRAFRDLGGRILHLAADTGDGEIRGVAGT